MLRAPLSRSTLPTSTVRLLEVRACRQAAAQWQRRYESSSPSQAGPSEPGPSSRPTQEKPPHSQKSPASDSSRLESVRSLLAPHLAKIRAQRAELGPKLASSLSSLGTKWNAYSGYDAIEDAKARVTRAENELDNFRRSQADLRAKYLAAVAQRAQSQRTINDLLSRKASWSDADLVQYTSLLRSEHAESRAEDDAREKFEQAERQVTTAWDGVVKRTLERYHDEQVWSDRVRNVSSYTQLAAVGLNVVLFIVAILLVEPYKRRRLAETFEKRLVKGEEQGRKALEGVIATFDGRVAELSRALEDLGRGQSAVLAAAGVPQSAVQSVAGPLEGGTTSTDSSTASSTEPISPEPSSLPEEQTQSTTSVTAPQTPREVLELAQRETRFLHSPANEEERRQRRIAVVAGAAGSVVGGVLAALIASR